MRDTNQSITRNREKIHVSKPAYQINPQTSNNSKEWLTGLDFLRASAVFLVVIGHGKPLLDANSRLFFDWLFPMPAAWGVELFFSLSGFLIGRQWLELINAKMHSRAGNKGEVRLFFAKRWLRTIPTYWLCLALYLCLGFSSISQPWPIWAIGNTLLISSLINIPTAIPVGWTLAIEELSYLWIGLSAWLINQTLTNRIRLNHAILLFPAAALTTGTMARLYAVGNHQWALIHHGTLQRIDALAYGTLAAWAIKSGWINPKHWNKNIRILAWTLCTTSILALQVWCERNTIRLLPTTLDHALLFAILIIPATGICSAMITGLLATQASSLRSQRINPLSSGIQKLAKISYTVYLTHIPVRTLFLSHEPHGSLVKFLAYICAAIVLGLGAYPIIENPFMALRKKYITIATETQRQALA